MPSAQQEKCRLQTLTLRMEPNLRCLIDRAAELSGKSRTYFVLSAARQAAENTLLDRTVFAVSPKSYDEFLTRLDTPPNPNARLRRALGARAPWEK